MHYHVMSTLIPKKALWACMRHTCLLQGSALFTDFLAAGSAACSDPAGAWLQSMLKETHLHAC